MDANCVGSQRAQETSRAFLRLAFTCSDAAPHYPTKIGARTPRRQLKQSSATADLYVVGMGSQAKDFQAPRAASGEQQSREGVGH
jgi:hypothetical protein